MAIVYQCDRCKRPYPDPVGEIKMSGVGGTLETKFDMCKQCRRAFETWMFYSLSDERKAVPVDIGIDDVLAVVEDIRKDAEKPPLVITLPPPAVRPVTPPVAKKDKA